MFHDHIIKFEASIHVLQLLVLFLGEAILSNRRACHYTPTEMFCICKRLKLPMADGGECGVCSMYSLWIYS